MNSRVYPTAPEQAYLFGTCLIDLFIPEAGLDALRVLEYLGIQVEFPAAQSCCGQPAHTSGNEGPAREVAAAQMALFSEPWPIVVPSGSCAGMMRHSWPLLFDDDPALGPVAREISSRVYEFAEFLVEVLRVDFSALFPLPVNVALHTSCTARREMGTREHGVALLAALPGVQLVEHENESECCGFGGVFSLKHPEISGAMVGDKTASVRASGCDQLVSADCGCLLNIGCAAKFQKQAINTTHLATFVARRVCGETS